MREREREREGDCLVVTYLGPPTEKVAGNKDVHFVQEVVEITFWISRSVDGTLISIGPLWQWLAKFRVKHS